MSLVKMNFYSGALHMRTEVTAVLPEYPAQRIDGGSYKEKYLPGFKFPILYFLNGFTGDYTDCLTMMPVERFVQETGIAVILPSGFNTWYEDIRESFCMKQFIAEELPAAMEAMLPISDDASKRFLGGLSMGGRGAAMISAQYYWQYKATVCLSAPLSLPELLTATVYQDDEVLKQSMNTVFHGNETLGEAPYDYYKVTEAVLQDGGIIPEMLYLFGKDDPLYASQYSRFVSFAETHGLPVSCGEWENCGHDFEFWEPAMKKAMAWLGSKLIPQEKEKACIII